MILTNDQEKALKIILEKYKNHEKYVTICGYAGVGKSTLVRFAIEALDVEEDKVAYATYTGKAAEVLRRKGNKNAITLHRLLYDSFPRPDGGFFRKPKISLDYDIVVVDEISLAPKSMLEMLLKHNVFCIFIGDNFQLPQINKDESHTYLENADIFLSTVMRQAQESEIIRLTMDIREGKSISYGKGQEVFVMPKSELSHGIMTWGDQILVGTNKTRIQLNNEMRQILGREGQPATGDKMIFLRNYWDICSNDEAATPIVNGTIGYLKDSFLTSFVVPSWADKIGTVKYLVGTIVTEEDELYTNLELDLNMVLKGKPTLSWQTAYKLKRSKRNYPDLMEVTYGYAITTHKAQGSEWDKVVVVEENFPFDRDEHARWLYTSVSRSSKKCVLLR
jgi:exodeoxyribonuclease-5